MVDYTLCVNEKCIYRGTCWRATEKHKHDWGGDRQSVSKYEWPKDKCYIPVDGKRL
jgi:hypothetical protein